MPNRWHSPFFLRAEVTGAFTHPYRKTSLHGKGYGCRLGRSSRAAGCCIPFDTGVTPLPLSQAESPGTAKTRNADASIEKALRLYRRNARQKSSPARLTPPAYPENGMLCGSLAVEVVVVPTTRVTALDNAVCFESFGFASAARYEFRYSAHPLCFNILPS